MLLPELPVKIWMLYTFFGHVLAVATGEPWREPAMGV